MPAVTCGTAVHCVPISSLRCQPADRPTNRRSSCPRHCPAVHRRHNNSLGRPLTTATWCNYDVVTIPVSPHAEWVTGNTIWWFLDSMRATAATIADYQTVTTESSDRRDSIPLCRRTHAFCYEQKTRCFGTITEFIMRMLAGCSLHFVPCKSLDQQRSFKLVAIALESQINIAFKRIHNIAQICCCLNFGVSVTSTGTQCK